jgi:hypothetical protein
MNDLPGIIDYQNFNNAYYYNGSRYVPEQHGTSYALKQINAFRSMAPTATSAETQGPTEPPPTYAPRVDGPTGRFYRAAADNSSLGQNLAAGLGTTLGAAALGSMGGPITAAIAGTAALAGSVLTYELGSKQLDFEKDKFNTINQQAYDAGYNSPAQFGSGASVQRFGSASRYNSFT